MQVVEEEGSDQYLKRMHEHSFHAGNTRGSVPEKSRKSIRAEFLVGTGRFTSRRFKSSPQAQRFPGVHAAFYNLFNVGRHLVHVEHYRNFREGAFRRWGVAVA